MSEQLVSRKAIFSGKAVRLYVDTVEKRAGVLAEREIVEHSDCVAVVPIDDDNNVVLVQQYRRPVGKVLLEIPAGGLEPEEDPEACVKRELQEEIGYLPGTIIKLGGIYAAPGYCTEYLHLYLVKNLYESRLVAEDTDEIETVRIAVDKIPELIKNGTICDAKSVAGLLRFMTENQGFL